MKNEELRLGNLIRLDLEDENDELTPYLKDVVKVCSIDEYSIKVGTIDEEILLCSKFENESIPIELTEDIVQYTNLIKLREWVGMYHSKDYDFEYSKFDGVDECATIFYKKLKIKEIKYLHELQNIYFELTSKELKIDAYKVNKIIKKIL